MEFAPVRYTRRKMKRKQAKRPPAALRNVEVPAGNANMKNFTKTSRLSPGFIYRKACRSRKFT